MWFSLDSGLHAGCHFFYQGPAYSAVLSIAQARLVLYAASLASCGEVRIDRDSLLVALLRVMPIDKNFRHSHLEPLITSMLSRTLIPASDGQRHGEPPSSVNGAHCTGQEDDSGGNKKRSPGTASRLSAGGRKPPLHAQALQVASTRSASSPIVADSLASAGQCSSRQTLRRRHRQRLIHKRRRPR